MLRPASEGNQPPNHPDKWMGSGAFNRNPIISISILVGGATWPEISPLSKYSDVKVKADCSCWFTTLLVSIPLLGWSWRQIEEQLYQLNILNKSSARSYAPSALSTGLCGLVNASNSNGRAALLVSQLYIIRATMDMHTKIFKNLKLN